MKLFECRCKVAHLARLRRPIWMRLVPFMRLCFCRNCKTLVFTVKDREWMPHFGYTFYRRHSDVPGWEPTQSMGRPRNRRGAGAR